jgi:hypothetical protein
METPTLLGRLERGLRLALSKRLDRVGVSRSGLKTETDPVSETLCLLVSGIPDNGQSPEVQ